MWDILVKMVDKICIIFLVIGTVIAVILLCVAGAVKIMTISKDRYERTVFSDAAGHIGEKSDRRSRESYCNAVGSLPAEHNLNKSEDSYDCSVCGKCCGGVNRKISRWLRFKWWLSDMKLYIVGLIAGILGFIGGLIVFVMTGEMALGMIVGLLCMSMGYLIVGILW